MTDKGYITIKENEAHEHIVEAKLVNGNLWLTKNEMAYLFNVYVSTVGNNLRAIFKSGLLREEDATYKHSFEHNGRPCEMTLYNLEALIFVGYRIASFEAGAFRQWVMKALCKYNEDETLRKREVLVVLNCNLKIPSVTSLN